MITKIVLMLIGLFTFVLIIFMSIYLIDTFDKIHKIYDILEKKEVRK